MNCLIWVLILINNSYVHLFLLSLVLTMAGPRVSISISAAPSLSWILQKRQKSHLFSLLKVLSSHTLMETEGSRWSYTAQWRGLKVLPSALWKTSCSSKTSTHVSWPAGKNTESINCISLHLRTLTTQVLQHVQIWTGAFRNWKKNIETKHKTHKIKKVCLFQI